MTITDPIDVLFAHDRWATNQLLEACAALSEEQFHQEFEMGTGSLHNNITHILGAMRGWTDVLAQSDEPRVRLEGERRTLDQLKTLHNEIADEFEAIVRAHPFDEIVSPARGDKTFDFARGGIFPHVMTHSMHHRAQCLNMLRQIQGAPMTGVPEAGIPGAGGDVKLPPSSVLEWMLMGNG